MSLPPLRVRVAAPCVQPVGARPAVRALLALLLLAVGGCVAPVSENTAVPPVDPSAGAADLQTLNAGDVIAVSFPGAPNLDVTQKIRRDGRINLSLVGEVVAAGQTPGQLESALIERYASQLTSKEIKVTVISTSFAVFVSGAVLKPGKIMPERAVTPLEAIMEAGGFDMTKADMKAVRVIRREGGKTTSFVVDLGAVLQGRQGESFTLKSFDIVYVPEKFSVF